MQKRVEKGNKDKEESTAERVQHSLLEEGGRGQSFFRTRGPAAQKIPAGKSRGEGGCEKRRKRELTEGGEKGRVEEKGGTVVCMKTGFNRRKKKKPGSPQKDSP